MPILGLDLGRHSFRAVEVEKVKNESVLNKYGLYDNPKINIDSAEKNDLQVYSDALRDFVIESGFSTPHVVVALPENQVFMRIIKVPEMSDKDLKNSIQFEAEQYIPLPLKEVSLSYQKIDGDFEDKGKINVQLVAARKTVLEKYIELLKRAKLTPRALEPETLSIGRTLGDSEQFPLATIIVNVGYTNTLIVITYKGFVRFTRSLPMGGDALTRAIQQGLKLDYMQADEYKKIYGMDATQAEGKIFNILKPLFDNIILEIKRSKIFFTTHNPSVSINRVVITGGTALMPGLLFYIANNMDAEVEMANPWKNIQFSAKLESHKNLMSEQGPLFATAVGLALKEI